MTKYRTFWNSILSGKTGQALRFSLMGILLVGSAVGNFARAGEASQIWFSTETPTWKLSERWKTKGQFEMRFPEAEYLNYFYVSEKFYYKANDTWTLGVGPTVEWGRTDTDHDFTNVYRLDLEASPKFKLNDDTTLSLRTRWEMRWLDGKGGQVFNRVRQNVSLKWNLPDAFPLLKTFAVADEVFYETKKSKITMNRFYPAMVTFKGDIPMSPSLYYLYQSKRVGTSSDWSGMHVLGIKTKF